MAILPQNLDLWRENGGSDVRADEGPGVEQTGIFGRGLHLRIVALFCGFASCGFRRDVFRLEGSVCRWNEDSVLLVVVGGGFFLGFFGGGGGGLQTGWV